MTYTKNVLAKGLPRDTYRLAQAAHLPPRPLILTLLSAWLL